MFQLARQMQPPVLVTASTHLGVEQAGLADAHFIVDQSQSIADLSSRLVEGVNLFTGPTSEDQRTRGLAENDLEDLRRLADELDCPLLVEADGSRGLPLKAPAAHEPAIPAWANMVAIVVGLSGLDKPLAAGTFHRPEIFAELSGAEMGKPVGMPAILHLLLNAQGGLKNIPAGARKVVIFNQADTAYLQAEAAKAAVLLWKSYHSVLVASLGQGKGVHAVYEPTAGIVLAGGKSERLGQPKALLDWKGQPFIRVVVQTAIAAGLTPVSVVVGAVVEPIREVLKDLPVNIVENTAWQTGQSSSIRAGVTALPSETGSAIFLLCDQPQIPAALLRGLVEIHNQSLAIIISPLVDGKRANPNLFDRDAFQDLLACKGTLEAEPFFRNTRQYGFPGMTARLLSTWIRLKTIAVYWKRGKGMAIQWESVIAGVVLAAGLSRRMGQPKMILPWGGQTVIGKVVGTLQKAGIQSIIVVTGGTTSLVETALANFDVQTAFNPDYSNGDMLFSIQTGLAALTDEVQAALVVLGDQPQIEEKTVKGMLDLFRREKSPLIVPSYQLRRGHPWLIEISLWPEIKNLTPPATMRDFFQQHNSMIRYLEVNTASVLSDLDTPEDYQKNRPAHQG